MFEIFTHPDLSHQLVLVTVHAGQLTHVGEHVLDTIRQLQYINRVMLVTNQGSSKSNIGILSQLINVEYW